MKLEIIRTEDAGNILGRFRFYSPVFGKSRKFCLKMSQFEKIKLLYNWISVFYVTL